MGSILSTMSAGRRFVGGEVAPIYAGTASLRGAPITKDVVSRSFRAAVLLSGGIKNAEAAMLDAIQRMDPRETSDDTFFLACVRASIASGRQFQAMADDAEDASPVLAPELKRILLLSPHLRLGLVLRVLLGFSEEDCMSLNIRNASDSACAAVQQLARIREEERKSYQSECQN